MHQPTCLSSTKPRKRDRRGVEILELILVMPILFLTLVAAVQFSSVLAVDTTLCHAALEASRLASIGCDEDQIDDRVAEFLSIHGMTLGPGTRLVVEDDSGIVYTLGDASLTDPTIGTPVPSGKVRSTLIAQTEQTPIPNALRNYCVDFAGKQFSHVSVACVATCPCP